MTAAPPACLPACLPVSVSRTRVQDLFINIRSGRASVWSTLIGPAMSRIGSHWSRASLVILAAKISCNKEPSCLIQSPLLEALDARAGSLLHKSASVEITRNSPRHRGGPVRVRVSPLPDGQHALEGRGGPGLPRVPLRGHGRDERHYLCGLCGP